jgi:hypothetical protein
VELHGRTRSGGVPLRLPPIVIAVVIPVRRKGYQDGDNCPLPTGDINSRPPGLGQSAQTIKLPPEIAKPVVSLCKALQVLQMRDDALVVRVLTGAGKFAGVVQNFHAPVVDFPVLVHHALLRHGHHERREPAASFSA